MHKVLHTLQCGMQYTRPTIDVRPFMFELLPSLLHERQPEEYPDLAIVFSESVFDAFLAYQKVGMMFTHHDTFDEGFVGVLFTDIPYGISIYTDKYAKPEEKFVPNNRVLIAQVSDRGRVNNVVSFYAVLTTPEKRMHNIQTKPKPAGKVCEAVQFLGDPSIHPSIYWCPPEDIGRGIVNRGHWRLGGESHGGGYDSSSSWLDIGDWIVGYGKSMRIIHPEQFDADWQMWEGES